MLTKEQIFKKLKELITDVNIASPFLDGDKRQWDFSVTLYEDEKYHLIAVIKRYKDFYRLKKYFTDDSFFVHLYLASKISKKEWNINFDIEVNEIEIERERLEKGFTNLLTSGGLGNAN